MRSWARAVSWSALEVPVKVRAPRVRRVQSVTRLTVPRFLNPFVPLTATVPLLALILTADREEPRSRK